MPYEFAFHEGYIGDTHDNSDFDEEVHAFFQRHKLENVLGIRDIENRDHKYNIEVTEGKTNIMLAKGSLDKENTVTALWTFTEDEDRCNCREYCYQDTAGKHTGSNHGCG